MSVPEMFAIGSSKWNGIAKLSEEAGEVVQVIGKLMATGGKTDHWDGTDLRQRLIEETGDAMAACLFVSIMNGFFEEACARGSFKLDLFRRWHEESQVLTTEQNESTVQNS